MKKKLLSLLLVFVILLVGCGTKVNDLDKTKKVKIGVSPVPHEEITKVAQKLLKEEGIELEIKVFDDYIQPNLALNDGSLDANFFQHLPYLETFNKEKNTKLVSVASVHVEPIALYSKSVKNINDFKDGAEILIPADASNGSRALFLLEKNGLIKLKEGLKNLVTEQDILENKKNIKFTPIDAALIPKAYKEKDGAVINSNYAIQAGLNPLKDGLIIEGSESKYSNVIAVKKSNKDKEVIKKVIKAFQSKEVKEYIEKSFKGAVVPAF
ncbi:MetQ/NlpA family ABC transporter substrate-binding protein [Helcococcus ovis]|uniref:Lipoprotein n=3 Tax=Helcococcus ovis TaxID=72026 RepID=A0A4R9C2N3_9FIRM|nr:MetQ/NlpA family ABC transporter substrate-binding protein [Helcococcus ovis]TFF66211.1 ABC transporter substrate-binding protein [Helcococcus ovis]TFF66330.1 ABC transporter substrate-binding protein [Helcococcus ovis]TFF67310.1 ABC transporter substrate-binding protein [Helcococcus ovis]WNZ00962.1 MetQ/NlpA family ABC transporter substrate-binding protein [Helcococcus ovis]